MKKRKKKSFLDDKRGENGGDILARAERGNDEGSTSGNGGKMGFAVTVRAKLIKRQQINVAL